MHCTVLTLETDEFFQNVEGVESHFISCNLAVSTAWKLIKNNFLTIMNFEKDFTEDESSLYLHIALYNMWE